MMIIVMGKNASQESVEGVIGFIRNKGLKEHVSRGEERTIIGAREAFYKAVHDKA